MIDQDQIASIYFCFFWSSWRDRILYSSMD